MGLRDFIMSPLNRRIQEAASAAKEEGFSRGLAEGMERLAAQLMQDQAKKAIPRMYALNYPWPYIIPQNPERKPHALFDDRLLREISRSCDPLRSCIEQIKREAVATPIKIKVRDEMESTDEAVAAARAFFDNYGGLGERGKDRIDFEKQLFEDLLSIGCCAVGLEYTRGGDVYQAFAVDASTIRVAVDQFGFQHPEHPFEQWIMGIKTGEFRDVDVIYRGIIPQTTSPYFLAPIEVAVRPLQRFLQVDDWNSAYFKIPLDPEIFETFPESWGAEQVAAYLQAVDEATKGDPVGKRKARIMPPGSQVHRRERKDQDFADYEPRIVKRICSLMGVQPASIGYEGEIYKVAQDAAHQQTSTFGVGAVLQIRKAIYDRILALGGWPELEVVDIDEEKETQGKRAERLSKASGGPYITVNEARAEEGRDPVEGGDVIRTPVKPGGGDSGEGGGKGGGQDRSEDLERWERKALRRFKEGKGAAVRFDSEAIPESMAQELMAALTAAATVEDIRSAFSAVKSHADTDAD